MPGPKQNNNRKYSDANHQPRHKAADRKLHAEARQEVYNELSLEQKIAALPPEPHSKKQRARLMAALEKRNKPAPAKETKEADKMPEASESVKQQAKKYMKGK